MGDMRPPHAVRRPALAAVTTLLLAVVTACGSSGAPASSDLSPEAASGQEIAAQNGCNNCHSTDGRNGTGPTWQGLAGSTVTLDDGTTVTADDAYLRRSITDPSAQRVDGAAAIMPEFNLSPAEVDDLVAYIKSLSGS